MMYVLSDLKNREQYLNLGKPFRTSWLYIKYVIRTIFCYSYN